MLDTRLHTLSPCGVYNPLPWLKCRIILTLTCHTVIINGRAVVWLTCEEWMIHWYVKDITESDNKWYSTTKLVKNTDKNCLKTSEYPWPHIMCTFRFFWSQQRLICNHGISALNCYYSSRHTLSSPVMFIATADLRGKSVWVCMHWTLLNSSTSLSRSYCLYSHIFKLTEQVVRACNMSEHVYRGRPHWERPLSNTATLTFCIQLCTIIISLWLCSPRPYISPLTPGSFSTCTVASHAFVSFEVYKNHYSGHKLCPNRVHPLISLGENPVL